MHNTTEQFMVKPINAIYSQRFIVSTHIVYFFNLLKCGAMQFIVGISVTYFVTIY